MKPQQQSIFVSFVHGFHQGVTVDPGYAAPALWHIAGSEEYVYEYYFPVEPQDFDDLPYTLFGETPLSRAPVERHPRYGFTGLERCGDFLYAGSWNGIYKIDLQSKKIVGYYSNRYSCYAHKIHVDSEHIILVMPFKDMIVVMGHDGRVQQRLSIDASLNLTRHSGEEPVDWRFVSKPWSGSTGYYHFNNIQKIDGKLYLTSRNLGCFVEVDLADGNCRLRTMNHRTPVCLHDGDAFDGRYFFTSIDGKIIVASEPPDHDTGLFNYDLQVENVRLDEVEKNWCRGIAVSPDRVYVTIDGRYGSDLSFKLVELDRDFKLVEQRAFEWSRIGEERNIRFVTGFDIVLVEAFRP